jgi:hypothetical protein
MTPPPDPRRGDLLSLPRELLLTLLLPHCTLPSLVALSATCRTLRTLLRARGVGRALLLRHAPSLQYRCTLRVPLASTDLLHFALGTRHPGTGDECLLVTHTRLAERRVVVYEVRCGLAGDTRMRAYPLDLGRGPCALVVTATTTPAHPLTTMGGTTSSMGQVLSQGMPIPPEHWTTCPACRVGGARRLLYVIDKLYRAFFQTWADGVLAYLSAGSEIFVKVEHGGVEPDLWGEEGGGVPTVQTRRVEAYRDDRYLPDPVARAARRFFCLDAAPSSSRQGGSGEGVAVATEEDAPRMSPLPAAAIYNPWA